MLDMTVYAYRTDIQGSWFQLGLEKREKRSEFDQLGSFVVYAVAAATGLITIELGSRIECVKQVVLSK